VAGLISRLPRLVSVHDGGQRGEIGLRFRQPRRVPRAAHNRLDDRIERSERGLGVVCRADLLRAMPAPRRHAVVTDLGGCDRRFRKLDAAAAGDAQHVGAGVDRARRSLLLFSVRDVAGLATARPHLSQAARGSMAEENTASERLVNNVILTLVARGAMIVATGLILLAALVLGSRGLSNLDDIAKKLDAMKEQAIEQAGEIKALRARSAQQQFLTDHEAPRSRARKRVAHDTVVTNCAGMDAGAYHMWYSLALLGRGQVRAGAQSFRLKL
jgi:hypothetical protein